MIEHNYLMMGQSEFFLQQFVERKARDDWRHTIDCAAPLKEIRTAFKKIAVSQSGSLVIRIGAKEAGRPFARMALERQQFLLPLIDEFAGTLLILHSPHFVPVIGPLLSRTKLRLSGVRRRGRRRDPFSAIAARLPIGQDRGLHRSLLDALRQMILFAGLKR